MSQEVANQYRHWPYPDIPLIASIPREQLWQINVEWMLKRAGLLLQERKAKIWIAGCGTFQPYSFSQANPNSEILATDVSETSLKIAKKRCFLHFNRNIDFRALDLEKEDQLPEDSFDYIECYGVLMNLQDPKTVLANLAKRLKPNGMLRIMVYPHYGRQRIFQIQRLGKLLGLSAEKKEDPSQLRSWMKELPKTHVLRQSFFSYDDSRSDSGIVDAFLHAGDRAFTGTEICELIEASGLKIAYTMHRPWGDPRKMAVNLGLEGRDTAFLLNYLDVWQSLRSNFILNLTHAQASPARDNERPGHPLFSFTTPGVGLKHQFRLLRFAMTGTRLQTRTYDGSKDLSASSARNVLLGKIGKSELERSILDPDPEKPLEPLLSATSRAFKPTPHWVIREDGTSPMDAYLHDTAFFQEGDWRSLGDERKTPTENYLNFTEASLLLTNERQRTVYKILDNMGATKRNWEKSELLELWYLLRG